MKKILTMAATLLLLTACGNANNLLNGSDTKSSEDNNSQSSLSIVGSSSSDLGSLSSESSSSENNSQSSSSSIQTQTETLFIGTKDLEFTGNLWDANPSSKFVSYVNGLNTDNVLSGIQCTKSQIMEINDGNKGKYNILTIGSGSENGELTFNFNYSISKITLVTQGYNKYVSYSSTWNIDYESELYVEEDENKIDMSTTVTDTAPEVKTTSFSFEKGLSSITLYNKSAGKRSFVHSITIEYNK